MATFRNLNLGFIENIQGVWTGLIEILQQL
jgi:hypothetical protein